MFKTYSHGGATANLEDTLDGLVAAQTVPQTSGASFQKSVSILFFLLISVAQDHKGGMNTHGNTLGGPEVVSGT